MLIAGAQAMKGKGLNPQQDALFVGQDIDARCARMTFIQLSLLGIPAVIICGDSLAFKTYWQRETIGCYIAGMEFRLRAERMLKIIKELECVAPDQAQEEKQPVEINLPRRELVQAELF
jgi:hypothetical protein